MPSETEKELEERLAKYEKGKAEKAKLFDPIKLAKSTDEERTVDLLGLGEIRFKPLTFEDGIELAEAKTPSEQTILIVYLAMKKTYPELTRDHIKRMPAGIVARLIEIISRESGFLSPRRRTFPA